VAYLTQILRSVVGMELGLDLLDNLVLGGHKIFYNHRTGTDGVVDLAGISGVGAGAEISFTSPSGATVDPNIASFVSGFGGNGTGRINVTITANTSWEGLPAGTDGQTILIVVVAGNFTLTLLARNGSTLQSQILASNNLALALYDSAQLIYSSSLGKWVLIT